MPTELAASLAGIAKPSGAGARSSWDTQAGELPWLYGPAPSCSRPLSASGRARQAPQGKVLVLAASACTPRVRGALSSSAAYLESLDLFI